jgi:hypothetical protein
VNLSQYYACLYDGQNNPGCSGYTPQPPSGYGYLHNQAANAFASGLKVDGALTLWGAGEVAGQASRNGTSQQLSVWISPALSGTLLMQGLEGSFVKRTVPGWREVAGQVTRNGGYERNYMETLVDVWMWVSGGGLGGQEPVTVQEPSKGKGSNNSQNQYKDNLKPCIPEWIKDDIQIKIKNELTISGADINYAGRTIFAEAADSYRGGKYKERLAIGSVLYNRIANPVFMHGSLKTFTDVANDKNQFEAITRKDLIRNTKLPYNHKFLSSDRENAGGLSEAACEELNASIQAAWNVANGGSPYGFTSFRGGTKIRPGQILIDGSRFW